MKFDTQQKGGRGHQRSNLPELDKSRIVFPEDPKTINAELFSSIAHDTAKKIAGDGKKNYGPNKPTQLRRFYEEIVMWDNKLASIQVSKDESRDQKRQQKFLEYLPFIRMLNAKVMYAHGRNNNKGFPDAGLVDRNYVDLVSHCLGQVNTPAQMQTFKLFMEAFMGFYKVERPRD